MSTEEESEMDAARNRNENGPSVSEVVGAVIGARIGLALVGSVSGLLASLDAFGTCPMCAQEVALMSVQLEGGRVIKAGLHRSDADAVRCRARVVAALGRDPWTFAVEDFL